MGSMNLEMWNSGIFYLVLTLILPSQGVSSSVPLAISAHACHNCSSWWKNSKPLGEQNKASCMSGSVWQCSCMLATWGQELTGNPHKCSCVSLTFPRSCCLELEMSQSPYKREMQMVKSLDWRYFEAGFSSLNNISHFPGVYIWFFFYTFPYS